jgi:hypothetical protein
LVGKEDAKTLLEDLAEMLNCKIGIVEIKSETINIEEFLV